MVIYLLVQLACAAMVAGPYLNDRAIAAHPGTALARVTGVTATRTTVEYQDAQGIYHQPPGGVLYPGGLGVGQRVRVEYSTANPELVKVAGRTWTLSLIPALSTSAIATLIAAAAIFLLQRSAGRLGGWPLVRGL